MDGGKTASIPWSSASPGRYRRGRPGRPFCLRKYAIYPGNNFQEHLKPFTQGVFALDGATKKAGAVMPYYTISYDVDQKNGENVGNSYSRYLINDLLREELGYEGVVCTDLGHYPRHRPHGGSPRRKVLGL